MDLVEGEEVAMAAVIAAVTAVVIAAVTAVAIAAVTAVAIAAVGMAAVIAAVTAVVIAVVTAVVIAVVTAVVVLNLIAFTLINLLGQKVGKTEVMEILLKTLNMKVGGAGEKGECLMILQKKQIRNPSLQELSLILLDIQYLILFL